MKASTEKHDRQSGRILSAAALCFGMLLANKQYAVLLSPFIFMIPRCGKKLLLLSSFVAAVIVLPFVLWNPHEFARDTVGLIGQLRDRFDGLSLHSAWHWWIGGTMSPYASFISYGAVLALFSWQRYWHHDVGDEPASFLSWSGLALLAFFIFARFAYLNYYWLASTLILLSFAAEQNAARQGAVSIYRAASEGKRSRSIGTGIR